MISFSTNIANLIAQGLSVEGFYLLQMGNKFMTSYFRNLIIGGNNYIADGSIVQVEPPQLSSSVDRQPFKITLADEAFSYGPVSDKGLLGTFIAVRAGFVDPTTKLPFMNLADTILMYQGKIDGTNYTVNTSKLGESYFILTCTTPMGDLDLTRAFYTSQDFMDKNFPGDTSYEQIFEGSGQINVKWGRA